MGKSVKRRRELKKHPVKRSFRKVDPEKLKEYVRANPDAYLREIANVFNCSSTAVLKSLNKLNITRKKKTTHYHEQDPQKVKEYLEKIKDVPKEKIVYIDETGIDNCLSRQYGRSPKGARVYGKVYGYKFKRTNIVAAQQNNQILAPLQYNGIMHSKFFEAW